MREATEGQPAFAEAYYWSATVAMQRGRESEALAQALIVEKLRPGIPEMRSLIGVVRYHEGDVSAARAAFESTLEVDSQNEVAHRSLAIICDETQQWSNAARHYQCLLALQPDSWWALSGLFSWCLG